MTRIARISAILASVAGTLAILLTSPVAATRTTGEIRHPRLCGVEFRNGQYRFDRTDKARGYVSIERLATPGVDRPIVMRFDAAADFVDFVVRLDGPGSGPIRAELVAYDANGKVVDTDRGRSEPGALTTMQVVADSDIIREVHFRFEGADEMATVHIFDLDVGAHLDFCPFKS